MRTLGGGSAFAGGVDSVVYFLGLMPARARSSRRTSSRGSITVAGKVLWSIAGGMLYEL